MSGITEERVRKAKSYTRSKRITGVLSSAISAAFLILLLVSGYSAKLEEYSYGFSENPYLAFLIFLLSISAMASLLVFPLSFYSGYILEHKYELSNQKLSAYFFENLKSVLVAGVIGLPVALFFYYSLRSFPDHWWMIFGAFSFLFSVVLGRFIPVVILPLFYKIIPVSDKEVTEEIERISNAAGVDTSGVFTFDMSKNTNKVNAFFTGIGKSKRILLADNLMQKFSLREISSVFAHEAGHYKYRHVFKIMLISAVITFAGLYLTALVYSAFVHHFGFSGTDSLAALPMLAILLSAYNLISSPLSNIMLRHFERQADRFSLEATKDKEAFISVMEKLADNNLSERSPNRLIEFLFHSHPSIEKRIQFAKSIRF